MFSLSQNCEMLNFMQRTVLKFSKICNIQSLMSDLMKCSQLYLLRFEIFKGLRTIILKKQVYPCRNESAVEPYRQIPVLETKALWHQ